jgi:hypothetical protein
MKGEPYAERVVVTETPSWRSAWRSSRDMDVYASDNTNRMAVGRRTSEAVNQKCIHQLTSEEVALSGPISTHDDVMPRREWLDLGLVAVYHGVS